MWSNFFARAEQSRARAARPRRPQMSEGRETALKLGLLLAGLGLVLMVTAAGTDHWGQLATRARPGNATCRATHFGLWRQCLKTILQSELEDEEGICGPVDLPGVSNCSYFQFFTTGEATLIMDRHAEKELFIVAAVLAIICMCLIILGSISIGTALNRNLQFLLKLSATFFISAGLAGVATLLSFDRAALGVLRAVGETELELTLRWSFGCGIASTLFTSLAGLTFLLLSLPPLSPCTAKAGGA